MPAQPAAGGLETELCSIRPAVAQVEPRRPQPAYRERLELVPGVEDSQHRTMQAPAWILGRMSHLVEKLACTRLADAAAAEIIAWALPPMLLDQGFVDERVDPIA